MNDRYINICFNALSAKHEAIFFLVFQAKRSIS